MDSVNNSWFSFNPLSYLNWQEVPSCVDPKADSERSPDEDPIAVVSDEALIEPQSTGTPNDDME